MLMECERGVPGRGERARLELKEEKRVTPAMCGELETKFKYLLGLENNIIFDAA